MSRLFRKKILPFIFFICLIHGNANSFDIKASTAILQDFLSGEILYEKEPDRSIYPASMTKIMTSIIAFDLSIAIILALFAPWRIEKLEAPREQPMS